MFSKVRKGLILSLVLLFVGVQIGYAKDPPSIDAKSYILMDFATGSILKESNAHHALPPASMTKMMTALLILDRIKSGELQWEKKVPISSRAAKIGHAHVDLKAGTPETVKDLFYAMLVRSANNAAVALAEYAASSEEQFVALMNQKAKRIGMVDTHFSNVTGLEPSMYADSSDAPKSEGPHVMSAYDTAILCRYILNTHPDILAITSMPKVTLDQRRTYVNWNEMLKGFSSYYPGVDGMKTGHTDDAGYCFTATARRGAYRLITVVMDTPSKVGRFKETAKLLDEGFTNYSFQTLVRQGVEIKKIPIDRGVSRTLPVSVKQPLQVAMVKGERSQYTVKVIPKRNLRAPMSKGDVVGKVIVLYRGEKIPGFVPVDAIANQAVEKENWFRLLFRGIGDWIAGWFS